MTDIFISYAREDEVRIQHLAIALEEQGWSVFWDRRIPTGQTWRSYIGRALEDARCVIVAWSRHSIASKWVIEEADEGQKRAVLVPVLLDPIEPPLGFRSIQACDLIDWQPGRPSPRFRQLVEDIQAVLRAAPRAPKTEAPVRSGADIATRTPEHLPSQSKFSSKLSTYTVTAVISVLLVAVSYWGYQKWIVDSVDKSQIQSLTGVSESTQPKVLYTDTGPYHLGDEEINGWPKLQGSCFEVDLVVDLPIKSLELKLETYGVENSSIKLNGQRVTSLQPQPKKPGSTRPNYWSSERSVILPTNLLHPGSNKLTLCAEPVADPEFAGDKDDFQFRNLKIIAEK